MRQIQWSSFQRHAFSEKAVRLSPISFEVDYSAGCSSPCTREFVSRVPPRWRDYRAAYQTKFDLKDGISWVWNSAVNIGFGRQNYYIDIHVPCRKCDTCGKRKQRLWQARAVSEIGQAKRTWFCTFTFSPEHRLRLAVMARQKYGDENPATLTKMAGVIFTLYLKRVRKSQRVPLRFLLAVEYHADGFPHLHALIHERGGEVGKRALQQEWPYGHSLVKLADIGSARYVAKYVAKSPVSRMRASLRYGQFLT